MADDEEMLDHLGESPDGQTPDDDDEISLDNLEELMESADEESTQVQSAGQRVQQQSADEEKVVEQVVFAELSPGKKVLFCLKAILGFPLKVLNEFLYLLGAIEHGVKNAFSWLFRTGLPEFKQKVSEKIARVLQGVKKLIPKMPDMSWIKRVSFKEHRRQIILFVSAIVILLGGVKLIFVFKSAFLAEPFLPSLESVADDSFRFEEDRLESFYSSPRFAAFSLSLPQMLINLSPGDLGTSSMAAFKFSIELSSESTVNEVEAKKAKVIDLMQRSISEWTYNDLVTASGKRKMRNKVLDEVNQVLTSGRIKHLYIDTVILKP